MTRQRRARGEGNIYKRADGRWEARLMLDDGRRKSFYAADQKTAQARLRVALADLENGIEPGDDRLTFQQYVDVWLPSIETKVRPRTFVHYRDLMRRHVIATLGSVKLRQMTPAHVDRLLTAKSKAGLSPRTVAHIRTVMRKALNDALKKGYVVRNVAALTDPPRVERYEPHVIAPGEAMQIVEAVKGDPLGPLFVTMLATGARPGELFGLRWSDVDLDARKMTIRQTVTRINGRAVFGRPKTNRSRRDLGFPEIVGAVLSSQRVLQEQDRLLAGERWQDLDLVFTTSIGTPLEGGRVLRQFHRLLDAAGLPKMRVYDLRHGYATVGGVLGVPLKVISETMGHSSIKLTADTYSHVIDEQRRQAADVWDQLLAPPPEAVR